MMQAGLGAFAPNAVGAAPPMPPVPTQPGGIAPLPDPLEQLLEQSRMVKQINAKRAGEGQQAGAQMAQGMPTVREQIARALGAAPYGFAGGGIVAFADGGDLGFQGGGNPEIERILKKSPYSRTPEENEKLEAAGIPLARRTLPADSWIRRFDQWLASPFIREATTSGALNLSDEDLAKRTDTGAVNEKLSRSLFGAKQVAPTADTTPTLPAYLDESRRLDVLPAARPATAAQPAATPAARPPASATPDVQPPPAAQPDGLGDAFNAYRREQDILADLVRSQSGIPDEVLEARRQYDTATSGTLKGEEDALAEMEAAAQRGMFDNDEILAGILAGMQGTDRLGETLLGAATGAARGRASQKKAVAEAKKDLNKLRRELAMKQAELQLARKEGDVNRARTAAVEVQKIKVAIEDKSMEQRLKEVDAETRRIAANASMTSAQQRGSSTDETANLRRAQAMRADPQYGGIQKEFEEATRMAGIAPQSASVQARLARARAAVEALAEAYGVVTLPATSGASATAPGAAPAGWGQPQVVKP